MKHHFISVGSLLITLLFAGCVKDDPITAESVEVWPSSNFTTQVHFVSKLTNAPIGTTEADYAPINTYFTTTLRSVEGSWLGIIDRTDVSYHTSAQQNPVLKSALDSKHWTYLAFNKISASGSFEGSTLLLNAPVIGSESHKIANDCHISGQTLKMEGQREDGEKISFDIYFRTARFETQAHLAAFGGDEGVMSTMKRNYMNFLMIGTVKKDLVESLKTTVENTDNAFNVFIVENTENADYAIFVLAEKHFWNYAGSSVTSLGNGINAYALQLNW